MGQSSLLGATQAALETAGRDLATLGPSDSSDSGSDMAGIDEQDTSDPTEPVDVALREDGQRPLMAPDSDSGSSSDAAGTGERRSAGSDAGQEAADLSPDRVFDPNDENISDPEHPDRAFIDETEAGDPLEDESPPD